MGWMNVPREMTQWGEVPLTPAEWLRPSKISQTIDEPGSGLQLDC